MKTREILLDFLSKKAGVPADRITGTTGVYNSGLISSLAILELMSHIEKQFEIQIRPEELIESNFRDVNAIEGFIQRKREPVTV